MAGFQTGAKADEFLGAPGSILIDPIRALVNEGLREGEWGSAVMKALPTAVRNLTKVASILIGDICKQGMVKLLQMI